MKVVKKEIEVYECEVCGVTCADSHSMEQHQKTHKQPTCEHPKIWYTREVEDDYGTASVSITAKCQDCLIEATVYVSDYDQTELAKLFEVLYGSKAIRAATEVAKEKQATWEEKQVEFRVKYGRDMTDDEKAFFAREQ